MKKKPFYKLISIILFVIVNFILIQYGKSTGYYNYDEEYNQASHADSVKKVYFPLVCMYNYLYQTSINTLGGDWDFIYPAGEGVTFNKCMEFEISTSSDNLIGLIQNNLYDCINECNWFLEKDDTWNLSISSDSMNCYKGTIHFARALTYYHLLRSFGGVYPAKDFNAPGVPMPGISGEIQDTVICIFVEGDTSKCLSTYLDTANVQQVYDYIIADLDTASNYLPIQWDTSNTGIGNSAITGSRAPPHRRTRRTCTMRPGNISCSLR